MISLLFPRRNCDDKPERLGVGWFIRVTILLGLIAFLTWYAKIREPQRVTSRNHGMSAWFIKTPQGITSYIIFPDDNNDSNEVKTGVRLILNPPIDLTPIGEHKNTYHRGPFVIFPDSNLPEKTIITAKLLIDSTEKLLFATDLLPGWLHSFSGSDVHGLYPGTGNARIEITWNSFTAKWWKNRQAMLKDSVLEPLSIAVLETCYSSLDSIPQINNPLISSYIYCGPPSQDSSRITIKNPEISVGLIEEKGQLFLKPVHLNLIGYAQ